MTKIPLLTLPAFALLAGCNYLYPPTSEERFGEAVHHNMAVQIVNPEPLTTVATPPWDGNRAALMIGRYKTDEVEEPEALRTTDVGGGSEGGGGGGGGGE